MSLGDPNYVIVLSGSAATSIAGVHRFFGLYDSLSQLNQDETLHIQTAITTNEIFIGVTGQVSNNIGLKLYPGTSGIDLPPMRAAQASQLLMSRAVSNLDGSHNYVVWARRP